MRKLINFCFKRDGKQFMAVKKLGAHGLIIKIKSREYLIKLP